MNKALRLALLLSLTALASWTSTPKAAYALPTCNNLQGFHCFPPRSIQCNWIGGGGAGFCTCDSETSTWDCF